MAFHFVASTGRTATTFIAATLDALPGVAACHEGYRGSDKDSEPLLPLINLENARAYARPESAAETVAVKRSPEIVDQALAKAGAETLIDIAYYNPMFADALLAAHPAARMVAIVRDCESFVRSATTLEGEDPLPVGWPAADKAMSRREQFIAMGRIKPAKNTPDHAEWDGWSAIRRNIWLWRETNLRLVEAAERHGGRALILPFSRLKADPEGFWASLSGRFGLPDIQPEIQKGKEKFTNKKAFGYQIGTADAWTPEERAFLTDATQRVGERLRHVSGEDFG